MRIGDWVRRERRQLWHLVESVVADDAFVKCGRRMRNEPNTRGGLVTYRPAPTGTFAGINRCDQCR